MVWDGLELFGMVWDCLGLFGMVWDGLKLFGVVWDGLGLFGVVWDGLEWLPSDSRGMGLFGDGILPSGCFRVRFR